MNEIVVGIDESSGSQRALEWALAEAALRQATVRMVHATPSPESYYPYRMSELDAFEADRDAVEQVAREILESALAKAGGEPAGVAVELEPRFGTAAAVLVDAARDAALLVVGSRGRGGFPGLLLGSVSQQILHHAPCTVAVVPAQR